VSPLTTKGIATRQRIVDSAAALVREHGAANVSLDDIRAATATSKSQLFHYFPAGKSELLLAVAGHEADLVLADQQPLLGDLTTWPKWLAWRERVIAIYDGQRDGCPLSALTAQLGQADPAIRQVVADLYDRWHAYLAAGVRALAGHGENVAGSEADAAATAILNAITGGATLLQATGRLDYLQTALTQALKPLHDGS
jgi:AcrR family transcriptional regulator